MTDLATAAPEAAPPPIFPASAEPRRLVEPSSPFLSLAREPAISLDDLAREVALDRPLLVELLSSPRAIADRVLERATVEGVVVTSLATIFLGNVFFAVVALASFAPAMIARSASLLGLTALVALAAALGPIYAASLLLAARVPVTRLVGVILSSAATGTLILAASAPIPFFLFRLDRGWAGPLSVAGAFALSGLVSGGRMHSLLHALAERTQGALRDDERRRVGILARVSLVLIAFTLALSFWAFDAV